MSQIVDGLIIQREVKSLMVKKGFGEETHHVLRSEITSQYYIRGTSGLLPADQ